MSLFTSPSGRVGAGDGDGKSGRFIRLSLFGSPGVSAGDWKSRGFIRLSLFAFGEELSPLQQIWNELRRSLSHLFFQPTQESLFASSMTLPHTTPRFSPHHPLGSTPLLDMISPLFLLLPHAYPRSYPILFSYPQPSPLPPLPFAHLPGWWKRENPDALAWTRQRRAVKVHSEMTRFVEQMAMTNREFSLF